VVPKTLKPIPEKSLAVASPSVTPVTKTTFCAFIIPTSLILILAKGG
jgi:hypothetical protein